MITFFTTFRTYSRAEQNAIVSWLAIGSTNEVIVFTEAEGLAETINDPRVSVRPVPARHSSGPPLLDGIFEEASRLSRHALLCYCNSDIILLPDFMTRARALNTLSGYFLAVSQRIDIEIDFELDRLDPTFARLRSHVESKGKIHPPTGSDVFLFPKGQYTRETMPPLVVGRPAWDNWMFFDARNRFNRLIDLTGHGRAVVHQDHPANYHSANPAHQVNYTYLPPTDPYTFVLAYCNYKWTGSRIEKIEVAKPDLKRMQWEMRFAPDGWHRLSWWMMWKFKIAKKKIRSWV